MKKKEQGIALLLFSLAALLAVGFAVALYFDATLYYPYGSSPFGLYVAERFVEFIIPAAACLVAGFIFMKKQKRKGERS